MHNVDIPKRQPGTDHVFCEGGGVQKYYQNRRIFNLSQPTLSKKLKSLEAQLDLQLFFRSGKSFVLTPAGKYLYENVA